MFKSKSVDLEIAQDRAKVRMAQDRLVSTEEEKNEVLACYIFKKFENNENVTFDLLRSLPEGEEIALPTVKGGAILTTREVIKEPGKIKYRTNWTSGATLTLHFHEDAMETLQLIAGHCIVIIEITPGVTETHKMKAGDKLKIAAGVKHQVTALTRCELDVYFDKIITAA